MAAHSTLRIGPQKKSSAAHGGRNDAHEWAARCDFWIAESPPQFTRRRRERESAPLILTGHGLSIRVDKGCLLVHDGNTHYPASAREWRFFNGALDLPPAIVVDGSGEIPLDAMDWLATQGATLIRLRWNGEFVSVVSAGGHAADPEKVFWQEKTQSDPKARLKFAPDLIRDKAHSTAYTMEVYTPRSRVWDKAFKNIEARFKALEQRPPRSIEHLLGIEGAIAMDYFRAWSGVSLQWKALKQWPIPDEWHKYTSRVALRANYRRNRGTTHPVNAMLNYAYGVLVARTQIRLIADRYDRNIGIFHDRESERGSYPAFALDHM